MKQLCSGIFVAYMDSQHKISRTMYFVDFGIYTNCVKTGVILLWNEFNCWFLYYYIHTTRLYYILAVDVYVGAKLISVIMEMHSKMNTVLHQQQLLLQEITKSRVKNTPQLPAGVELPLHTLQQVQSLERQLQTSATVKCALVCLSLISFITEVIFLPQFIFVCLFICLSVIRITQTQAVWCAFYHTVW